MSTDWNIHLARSLLCCISSRFAYKWSPACETGVLLRLRKLTIFNFSGAGNSSISKVSICFPKTENPEIRIFHGITVISKTLARSPTIFRQPTKFIWSWKRFSSEMANLSLRLLFHFGSTWLIKQVQIICTDFKLTQFPSNGPEDSSKQAENPVNALQSRKTLIKKVIFAFWKDSYNRLWHQFSKKTSNSTVQKHSNTFWFFSWILKIRLFSKIRLF